MIRVAANLTWLVPGRVGGSEEYAVRLIEAVIEHGPGDVDLRIVGSAALREMHPGLTAAPFDVVPGPIAQRPYRVLAESTVVHRLTRGADVVHHFGGRVPARHHGNDIVTIHDLQPLHLPQNFSAVKRRYLAWALPRSARSARLICTPSQWVGEGVTTAFGLDAARVRAVPSTHSTGTGVDPALADSLGSGPVVLYPAVTHPHKNHEVLLDAADELARSHVGLVVVLTGGAGRAEAAVAARVARAEVRVVRPGRVGESLLRGLMRRADVVAFPSRYEGFGLPVLEAMHEGTPVIAADSTALPEVVGDAGILVSPDDVGGWAAAIESVLTGESLAARLVEAGRRRAAVYSPVAAAGRLIEAWRSVN